MVQTQVLAYCSCPAGKQISAQAPKRPEIQVAAHVKEQIRVQKHKFEKVINKVVANYY